MDWGSSANVMTRLWAGQLGFNSWQRHGFLLFSTASGPDLRPTQPHIQWGLGVFSLGLKQLGHEADHSPPSSDEVKNVWSYTSAPQYFFMVWYLTFITHPLNSPSLAHSQVLNFLNGIKMHSIMKQTTFIAFFKLVTSSTY
jgi:hypothetical protein